MDLHQPFDQLPTPCYVVDMRLLRRNLEILRSVKERTGCKILLAQKAFSMYHLYPVIAEYLDGCASSGLFEARLAKEEMGKEGHTYSPAFLEDHFWEIAKLSDHIIFNSFAQWDRFHSRAVAAGCSCGLRLNPEHSTQERAIYDPCAPGSRLGVTSNNFRPELCKGLEGFHLHTLCEQNADALVSTLEALELQFGYWLHNVQWLNLGGGHHITREDYDIDTLVAEINRLQDTYGLQVYLEPGEAVVLNAGFLVTSVLEVVRNGVEVAILDTSAACHMPDVLEMPYRPPVRGGSPAGEKSYTYRLAGPTCLAGDVIGDYSFEHPLVQGDRIVLEDMALYTMVKNNTFNGMPLPAIAVFDDNGMPYAIREFGYEDFKNRLS